MALIMTLTLSGCAKQHPQKQVEEMKKKVLVAYFSCTGNTERMARAIAKATDGTLYRIEPAVPYTKADLDWHNGHSRSSREMRNAKARPALKDKAAKADTYDVIYLGYPIWWGVCPRAVNTFIEAYRLDGKQVIPFATSGGSDIAGSVDTLRQAYPAISWQPGMLLTSEEQAKDWATAL